MNKLMPIASLLLAACCAVGCTTVRMESFSAVQARVSAAAPKEGELPRGAETRTVLAVLPVEDLRPGTAVPDVRRWARIPLVGLGTQFVPTETRIGETAPPFRPIFGTEHAVGGSLPAAIAEEFARQMGEGRAAANVDVLTATVLPTEPRRYDVVLRIQLLKASVETRELTYGLAVGNVVSLAPVLHALALPERQTRARLVLAVELAERSGGRVLVLHTTGVTTPWRTTTAYGRTVDGTSPEAAQLARAVHEAARMAALSVHKALAAENRRVPAP